ncbi:hypothetical protein [Saccharopolyspora taberi]|uniref:Secreted protein n=1 Tax=Saccharopolyspora taberi TaxID=60895 RepID=A0ABN3V529_9PSEU
MRRLFTAALLGGLALLGAANAHAQQVVTDQECYDGGGGVAVDLATHIAKCHGGFYDGAVVDLDG